ncbi:MAG: alpha/beta hydrolase [Bacilli bacterium]|jgi:alpha-beta hydrolase superfamily lysophospholipase
MLGEEYIFTRGDGETIHGLHWPNEEAKAVCVMVTGMEEYAGRYESFGSFLVEQGYEVFCLDHIGQGANAIDRSLLGVWPIGAFETTVDIVNELVLSVKNQRPVYLFGHSLGSFVLQRYIQKYGTNVDKVILCGTNGPDPMVKIGFALANIVVTKMGYQKKSKLFNNMVFGAYAKAIPNAKTAFDWLSYNEENVARYIDDPYCGYGSTGGFYKEFLRGLSKLHAPKALKGIPNDLPVLLIAGSEDPVGKFGSGVRKLEALYQKTGLTKVDRIIYDKMRHEILNEREHERVLKDIATFYAK